MSAAFIRGSAQRLEKNIQPWIVPIVILVLWQLSSQSGWLSSRILPEP
jgi:sulfonate transport system permease protein